jgi:hypothetical protein
MEQNDKTLNRKIDFSLRDKIYLTYIFLYANIFASPLLNIIPVPLWKMLTVFFSFFYASSVFFCKNIQIKKKYIYFFIILMITNSLTAIYYQSMVVLFKNLAFAYTIIMFVFYNKKYMDYFIKTSTMFIIIQIIGAYIGFIYALSGGQAIFEFPNPDTRINRVYVTTCTNVVIGNFIRPSGIYDEPGALSFFICAVCLLRVLYKKNDNVTFIILLSALITTSLTHLLILLCFLGYYLLRYRNKKRTFLYIIIFIVLLAGSFIIFYDFFDRFFITRLQVNNDGELSGDNRSSQLFEAIEVLDTKTFFWGLDIHTFFGFEGMEYLGQKYNLSKGSLGENPLTLLASFGLFSSWHYYFILLVILIASILHFPYFLIFFAVCLLFFQRPFSSLVGYSFYFMIFFHYAISIIKKSNCVRKIAMFQI